MTVGKLMVVLGLDSKGFNTGLSTATKETTLFAKATDKTFKMIGQAAKIGMAAASAALIKGTIDAAGFEKALANVATMLDDETMPMMEQFRTQLLQMSEDYGESTNTLARGLYDILSASIPASEAMDVLEESAKAAKAGLTDTGVAADAITTLMNSFGDATKDASYYSDILFSTVKFGKTTFAELAPAVGNVAKLMETAGGSAEEMSAMLAIMTRNGIDTRTSITNLRGVLTALLKPTDELTEALDGMTVEADGFAAVMEKVGDMPPADLAEMFPNVRALTGVVVAAQDMSSEVEKINQLMAEGSPTAAAYAKQTDTLAFVWEQFKATLKATSITIGTELLPTAKELLTGMIGWLQENRDEMARFAKNTIQGIKTVLTTLYNMKEVLVAAGIAITGLMAISKVTRLMAAFGVATNLALGPVAAIVTATVALGTVIFNLTKNMRQENKERKALMEKQASGAELTDQERLAIKNAELARLQGTKAIYEESLAKSRLAGVNEANLKYVKDNIAKVQEQIYVKADEMRAIGQDIEGKRYLIETTEDFTDALVDNTEGLEYNIEQLDLSTEATEDLTEATQKSWDVFLDYLDGVDIGTEKLTELYTQGLIGALEYSQAIMQAKDITEELTESTIDLGDAISTAAGSGTDLVEALRAGSDEIVYTWFDSLSSIVGMFDPISGAVIKALGEITEFGTAILEWAMGDLEAYADTVQSVQMQIANAYIDSNNQIYQNTKERLDKEHKAEIESLEKRFEEALLTEEEYEEAQEALQETYQDKVDAAQEERNKKNRQYEIELAKLNKEITLAEIEIAREQAIADLGWFNKDKKAEVNSLYDRLVSAVENIPLPAAYINGGLVNAINGGLFNGPNNGIDTNLALLTRNEYVMPPQQTAAYLPELEAMRAGTYGGGNISISPMPLTLQIDGKNAWSGMVGFMTEASDRGQFRLNPRVLRGTE